MQRLIHRTAVLAAGLVFSGASASADETLSLLDPSLSKFELWMGIPHASVKDLPEGTFQSDNVHNGTPRDPNGTRQRPEKGLQHDRRRRRACP